MAAKAAILLRGDAYRMSGAAKGGNDTLIGGTSDAGDKLWGDAYMMQGRSTEETTFSGSSTDRLVGDAEEMHDDAAATTRFMAAATVTPTA